MHAQSEMHELTAPERCLTTIASPPPNLATALTKAAELAPAKFSYVSSDLIDFLRTRLRAQTPECIMTTLGISANTWTKLKAGLPVRTSVAQRLIERIAQDAARPRSAIFDRRPR